MATKKYVKIKVGNVKCKIYGTLPTEVADEIYEKLSFRKKNVEYVPSVVDGTWDGKTRLFDAYMKTFDTGLISLVHDVLTKHNYDIEIDDQRAKPNPDKNWRLVLPGNYTLYDYQQEAVYLARKYSRGAFAMPTGSGKTLAFTAVLAELRTSPVIVYVPNLRLLYQTRDEIQSFLREKDGKNVEVGIVGDGKCDIKDITIMTIQTAITAFDMKYDKKRDIVIYLSAEQIAKQNQDLLASKTKKKRKKSDDGEDEDEDLSFVPERKDVLKGLIQNAKLIICDEGHRCSSAIYQAVLKRSVFAYYRFVFSGTMFREDNTEMLIQAIFGRKLLHVKTSELIIRPDVRVVRPYIFMVEVPTSNLKDYKTYDQVRKNHIVLNETRNKLIANITEHMKQYGAILVLVGIKEHGRILEKMIPNSMFICSETSQKKQEKALKDLMTGDLPVLIATQIADEGLNLPDLKVLILCDSGKASNKLYQRIGRVIRETEGKSFGIVVDFKDKHPILADHTGIREILYLMEPEFIVTHVSTVKFKTVKGM